MYTNVSNIAKTLIELLAKYAEVINGVINTYIDGGTLTVFEGMRKTLPASAYPCLIIEPSGASNEWATTRAQRPRYDFSCTLIVMNDNENYGVEYPATIASTLLNIMTNPMNLNMKIKNETKWDLNAGLVENYMMDSFVDNATFNASKDGTIRTVEFNWWVLVHETWPDRYFVIGKDDFPDIITPVPVAPP